MTARTTEEILDDLFAELDRRADCAGPITQKLLILSTPRSGSTLFCERLRDTGVIGDPKEWCNLRYIGAFAKRRKLSNVQFEPYLDFVMKRTASTDGRFSLNLHIDQYVALKKLNIDVFAQGFDCVVYLRRRDHLSQAYSLAKARVTDQWGAEAAARVQLDAPLPHAAVMQAATGLATDEALFEQELRSRTMHVFDYEDFCDSARTECYATLFASLGLAAPVLPESTRQAQAGVDDRAAIESLRRWLGG